MVKLFSLWVYSSGYVRELSSASEFDQKRLNAIVDIKQLINDYQTKFICAENLDIISANRKAEKSVNRDLIFTSYSLLRKTGSSLK